MKAVQQGRVYGVSDDLWMLGIGYTAANGVIDDLTRYLLGGEATTGTTTGAMSGATTTGTSEATTDTTTEVTMESTS